MRLSDHFTLDELIFSQTAARFGIKNEPPAEVINNLRMLAGLLEQVRFKLGNSPIYITSGYRCPRLNTMIGGAENSAHQRGLAADIVVPAFGNPYEVAERIVISEIPYDKVIEEHNLWVHIQASINPRRQIFTARRQDGVTQYLPGLVDDNGVGHGIV